MAASGAVYSTEPTTRVPVRVTFLRMDAPPRDPAPEWPEPVEIVHRADCTIAEYRALYETVGADYCWWLRRTMSDRDLDALLKSPSVRITILRAGGRVAGFHELDRSAWPSVNISYFGLLSHAIGRGLGRAFLRDAVDTAWAFGARAITVNTCTADHRRALPTYVAAGFKVTRAVDEVWDVPNRLGLNLPGSGS